VSAKDIIDMLIDLKTMKKIMPEIRNCNLSYVMVSFYGDTIMLNFKKSYEKI
jgi:hypothetical protein